MFFQRDKIVKKRRGVSPLLCFIFCLSIGTFSQKEIQQETNTIHTYYIEYKVYIVVSVLQGIQIIMGREHKPYGS